MPKMEWKDTDDDIVDTGLCTCFLMNHVSARLNVPVPVCVIPGMQLIRE